VFGHSSRTIGNPPRGKEASAAQEEAAPFAVIDPKLFGVAIAARTNHTQRARRDMGREKGVAKPRMALRPLTAVHRFRWHQK
jgi:hypothetical protein